ncbi:MAG TPA: hypothetical protein PLQ81_05935, partial [bacterium]|nr:hypothetical protein [bacterium]
LKLNRKFQKYFWEYDFNELYKNAENYRFFIAERLLVFGDMTAVKWLKKNFLISELLNIIKKSKNIDAITKNYWLTIYCDK